MSANPLQELMRRGESGAAGYNAYNRGTYIDSHGQHHVRGPDRTIDLSSMTLGEIQAMQHLPSADPNRLFAVGKYQMIPATLSDATNALHLAPEARFTPQLQDRILFDYLIGQRRPAVHDYIVGKPGVSVTDAQHAMACEWASFGDPANGGRSHYPPPNHASITLEQSATALTSMRNDYRAAIERGLAPAAAWATVTGTSPSIDGPTSAVHATHSPMHSAIDATAHAANVRDVETLQRSLDRLGYRDSEGRHLVPDGHLGRHTREALEAFQRDHGLDDKGVYGPKTQAAMHASAAALVTSPAHPHHALFEHTLAKVRAAEHARGVAPGAHSERIAAALTTELVREGITRVDRVEFNRDNTLVRAVQVSPMRDETGLNHATDAISSRQASVQSIAESSRQMHEAAVNMQARRQDPQFTQVQPHVAPSPALSH